MERSRAEALWDEIWRASKTPEELAKGRDLSEAVHRASWLSLLGRAEPHAPGIATALYERVVATDGWLPYPDAAGVLSDLHARGMRIGVLSNIPSALRPLFERHGLASFVHAFVESHEQGREKHDRRQQNCCGAGDEHVFRTFHQPIHIPERPLPQRQDGELAKQMHAVVGR